MMATMRGAKEGMAAKVTSLWGSSAAGGEKMALVIEPLAEMEAAAFVPLGKARAAAIEPLAEMKAAVMEPLVRATAGRLSRRPKQMWWQSHR